LTRELAIARAHSWNDWILRDAQAWLRYGEHRDRARYVSERGPMPPLLATASDFAALSSSQ
jgi:hypothetical protein